MKKLNLIGRKFGRLTVISEAEPWVSPSTSKKSLRWNCVCECGTMKAFVGGSLKNGCTKSCGCYSSEVHMGPHHELRGPRKQFCPRGHNTLLCGRRHGTVGECKGCIRENAWKKQGMNARWEDVEAMRKSQGHKCAICGKSEVGAKCKLALDHNHETGQVRGLVCYACNTGPIKTCETWSHLIPKAMAYLKKHSIQAVEQGALNG